MLLECFGGIKTACKARRGLDAQLKTQGAALLDTVVVRVNPKHKSSVYDPRRVVQGTLTAFLTWGLFGLVAGGLKSLAIWAILGAVCGGLWHVHRAPAEEDELARIGSHLPAGSSSALVTFRTRDPRSLLEAAAARAGLGQRGRHRRRPGRAGLRRRGRPHRTAAQPRAGRDPAQPGRADEHDHAPLPQHLNRQAGRLPGSTLGQASRQSGSGRAGDLGRLRRAPGCRRSQPGRGGVGQE